MTLKCDCRFYDYEHDISVHHYCSCGHLEREHKNGIGFCSGEHCHYSCEEEYCPHHQELVPCDCKEFI